MSMGLRSNAPETWSGALLYQRAISMQGCKAGRLQVAIKFRVIHRTVRLSSSWTLNRLLLPPSHSNSWEVTRRSKKAEMLRANVTCGSAPVVFAGTTDAIA